MEELSLESEASHVTALSLAWIHQPYIDSAAVKDLVTILDSAIIGQQQQAALGGCDTAPKSGAAAAGTAGPVKSKRKKKKKPAAASAPSTPGQADDGVGDEDDGA